MVVPAAVAIRVAVAIREAVAIRVAEAILAAAAILRVAVAIRGGSGHSGGSGYWHGSGHSGGSGYWHGGGYWGGYAIGAAWAWWPWPYYWPYYWPSYYSPYYYWPYYEPPPPLVSQERPPAYAQPAPSGTPSLAERIFVYPRQGQSEERQATDRYECHSWAVSQTNYDPTQPPPGDMSETQRKQMRADYRRAEDACLDGRGYTVR